MTTGIPGGFSVFSFKLSLGHATAIPITRARIDEKISRCMKLLLLMFPVQTREAARTSTATTGTVAVAVAAEGDLLFQNSLHNLLNCRELRRGQSFGFEGGFENSGRGGFGGDPRRSTSPQSLQWRTRGSGGFSNSSRTSSPARWHHDHQPVTITNAPARSHRGKGNSRNNSPHGRFDPFLALSSDVGIVKTSFLPVPEATLDETRPTADPGPHHGKQGCSAELAAQG